MGDSEPAGSVEYWRQLIEAAEKSGDHLGAIDAALLGLEMHPCCHTLQYRAVLNLSRAGAAKRAMQLWQKFGLHSNREGLTEPKPTRKYCGARRPAAPRNSLCGRAQNIVRQN